MTAILHWRRVALAVFALATLALLLYTVGAPTEISGARTPGGVSAADTHGMTTRR